MHDTQYREAIAWQNVAYNQPPHPSFFLGNGMTTPPQPDIYTVAANPGPAGDFNDDGEVTGEDLPVWRQTFGRSTAQGTLPGDADDDGDADGADLLLWQRNLSVTSAAVSELQASRGVPTPGAFDLAFASLAGDGVPSDAADASEFKNHPSRRRAIRKYFAH
jgi:hypothetical protein